MQDNLSRLPNDMLKEILAYLDQPSLSNLRRQSHFFYEKTQDHYLNSLKQNEVEQILFGTNHNYSFLRKKNGEVWFSGVGPNINNLKQVTTTPKKIPFLSNAKQIYSYFGNLMILKADGSVYAMGDNLVGDLGVGDYDRRYALSKVLIPNKVRQVALDGFLNLFLDDKNQVWFAGNHNGTSDRTCNTHTPELLACIDDVKQVVGRNNRFEFLKNDGTVWFNNIWDTHSIKTNPTQRENIANIQQIATAYDASAYVTTMGDVLVRGVNDTGKLGLGHKDFVATSQFVPSMHDVTKVIMTRYSLLFLKNDGSVWLSGNKSRFGLGEGDTTTPIKLPYIAQVTDIQADNCYESVVGNRSLFMFSLQDGKKLFLGANDWGQLGLGHKNPVVIPEENRSLNRWVELTAMINDGNNALNSMKPACVK